MRANGLIYPLPGLIADDPMHLIEARGSLLGEILRLVADVSRALIFRKIQKPFFMLRSKASKSFGL